jgi:iron complex transport system substrate-binding protein
MRKYLGIVFLIIYFFVSCSNNNLKETNTSEKLVEIKNTYAKRFSIKVNQHYKVLQLFGSKGNIISEFVLYKNQKPNYRSSNTQYIKVPVKRVVSLSSIYTTMLYNMRLKNNLIAIDNVDYYTNKDVIKRVKTADLAEVSKTQQLHLEKIIALNSDVVFGFGMGESINEDAEKLQKINIPSVFCLDHLEESPLARAEWIKFFACFFEKETMADSIFNTVENNYKSLKSGIIQIKFKPKIMTEIKYGDTWFVPSGNSYVANLINDAGGIYFYHQNQKTGSTPLSFENVFDLAKNCDVWINLYSINTKNELISYDERYKLFKPFRNNRLYNNNKIQNELGYSNFWEDGILRPDLILEDLIKIFHTDTNQTANFNFYKKIK